MGNVIRGVLAACAAIGVLAISGCSGGGDESPAVPAATALATKVDLQRELGNAAGVVVLFGPDDGATTSAMSNGTKPRAPRQTAMMKPPSRRITMSPKAAQTTNCANGGSQTNDSGTKSQTFTFFGATRTVSWFSFSGNNCVENFPNDDGTTTVVSLNGMEEDGGSTDPYYYAVFGSGSSPLSFGVAEKNAAGATTEQFVSNWLGTLEELDTDTLTDVRVRASVDISATSAGQTLSGTTTFGDGAPMILTVTPQNTITLDGVFSYTTNVPGCPGGTEEFDTLQPIPLNASGYPVGGVLKVSSGGVSVTIAFNADGSATLTFANGTTVMLTAAEVSQGVDRGPCADPTAAG
jgi:hypothetical protein